MKLLIVGHSYITAFAQKKYVAMKKLDPYLQLRLVVPDVIEYATMRYEPELADGISKDELVSIKSVFGRTHMTRLLSPLKMVQLLRKFKPDLIHVEEDPHSVVGAETVLLARLICPMTPISFFIWDNLNRAPLFPKNLVKKCWSQFSLRRSVGVVTGNKEAQKLLGTCKAYKGKTIVLPQLGVDCALYISDPPTALRQSLKPSPEILLIGYVGRLVHEKGILDLCEALQGLMHLKWRFLLLGSGPLKDEISEKWAPIFGNRLILTAAVPHATVPDYMKCLDIMVLPSVSTRFWKEQFGLVLLQAMAAGVSIIGSNSGAIPEVIGDAGIVFPEGQISDLRKALLTLLSSPEKRTQLAEIARDRVRTNFSHEIVARAYLKTFSEFRAT